MDEREGSSPVVVPVAEEKPIIVEPIPPKEAEHEETLGERIHDFERWAMDEMHRIEQQVVNHHSAAYMLIAVFILGMLSAFTIATEPPPAFLDSRSETVYLSGYVINATGDPLPGSDISIKGSPITAETNADGYYYIGYVVRGTYEISASSANHSLIVKKVTLTGEGAQMVNFMLQEGGETQYLEEGPVAAPPSFFTLTTFLTLFIISASIMALVGAVYSYLGKNFKLTLVCGIASIMSYGFIAGMVLGLFAMVFIMLSKNDFDDVYPWSQS